MYSWEIEEYIKTRNYSLGGDDLLKVISLEENPQLTRIHFFPENNSYEMWDSEGHCFQFVAMNIEKAEEKGLVRKLQK